VCVRVCVCMKNNHTYVRFFCCIHKEIPISLMLKTSSLLFLHLVLLFAVRSNLFIHLPPYIGNDVVIDVATIRPFTVEEGYFLLLPITIGKSIS
jgi:hypothetical protein